MLRLSVKILNEIFELVNILQVRALSNRGTVKYVFVSRCDPSKARGPSEKAAPYLSNVG